MWKLYFIRVDLSIIFLSPQRSHYLLTIAWLESDFDSVMETYEWLVPKVCVLYKAKALLNHENIFFFKPQHVRPGDWVYSTLFDICAKAKRPSVALDLWEG